MSQKDKGFNFKRLFLRDSETGAQEKQIQKGESSGNITQGDYIANTLPNAPASAQDQTLVEDFVQRLQNLINQNNQAGFDFLEFTESLFEEKQNPSPEIYKTVFRIAQKIDKSLTPSRLLDSAMFYKELVQRTADTEINKGASKKQSLQVEKDTERNNLDNSLKNARAKIQQLTKQIQELQNQDVALSNQLSAIDQKYESQFNDIDNKINAIRNAKEQVLVSIVDIEAGIKSNLS
jgi:predicted  nucleic acid-binding Zn-ribbon protein